jgi:hypothetical protein
VARAINPGQSVKPGHKKGMALSKRWCFFGMVTPDPHARQNSPPWSKSNLQTGQAVRFKRIGPPCTNRGGPVVDNYRLSVLAYVASRWHVDCCGSDAGDCRAQFETGRRRDKVFRARRRIFSGLSASQSAAMARQPLAVALTVRSAEAGSQVGGWSVGRGPSSITLQSRNNVAILRLNSVSALGFTAPG